MREIEMKSIMAAMSEKQTWVKKELGRFLDRWSEITDVDGLNGFRRCELLRDLKDPHIPVDDVWYLKRNENSLYRLDSDDFDNCAYRNESWYSPDELSAAFIRRVAYAIEWISFGALAGAICSR